MGISGTTETIGSTSSTSFVSLSPTLTQTVQIPQAEYDKFLQFLSSQQFGHTANHATALGMDAFLTSSNKP